MWSRTLCVCMGRAGGSVFKPNHQIMDSFLDSGNLDWNEVGNWNFSSFWFSNIKSTSAFLVVKIVYFLVVDLVKGHENSVALFPFESLHDHFQGPWQYPSFLTGQKMVNVLFIVFAESRATVGGRGVISDDRVGFSRTGLTVGKNCYVGSSQELIYRLFEEIKDILLCRVVR